MKLNELVKPSSIRLLELLSGMEAENKKYRFEPGQLQECGVGSVREFVQDLRGCKGHNPAKDGRVDISLSGYAVDDLTLHLSKPDVLEWRDYEWSRIQPEIVKPDPKPARRRFFRG